MRSPFEASPAAAHPAASFLNPAHLGKPGKCMSGAPVCLSTTFSPVFFFFVKKKWGLPLSCVVSLVSEQWMSMC